MNDTVELLAFDRDGARLALRCDVVQRVDLSGGRHVIVTQARDESRAFVAEGVRILSVPAERLLVLPRLARASVRERYEAVMIAPEVRVVLSAAGIESSP